MDIVKIINDLRECRVITKHLVKNHHLNDLLIRKDTKFGFLKENSGNSQITIRKNTLRSAFSSDFSESNFSSSNR